MANLDFVTRDPNGNVVVAASGRSAHQTNEFAVFTPAQTGTYTVTVTGSNIDNINKPVQRFALASTIPIAATQSNSPPAAEPQTVLVTPGKERVVRLEASDADGDAVSFHVSKDPRAGVVSADEHISKTVSRMLYTAGPEFVTRDKFVVTPHDGKAAGTPASVTVIAESLPSGATVADSISDIRERDTFSIMGRFTHDKYEDEFPGKSYAVSKIRVGAPNMEGAEAEIRTTDGTYRIAIPATGSRIIEFATPLTIQAVVLSAAGIEEEAVQNENRNPGSIDAEIYVDYVSADCSSTHRGLPACPSTATHRVSATSNQPIQDNQRSQGTSSPINVITRGTLQDISVSVDIRHTARGDLRVVLTSPEGREAVLHDRAGGTSNHILKTYTLSDEALKALVGAETGGMWTLSVGDYAGGNTGTLRNWSMFITYIPAPFTTTPSVRTHPPIFTDSFESGLKNWVESGERDWTVTLSSVHSVPTLPGHPRTNQVLHADTCSNQCIIAMKDSLDLTEYTSVILTLSRFVDRGLETGEYLRVEAYDGRTWVQLDDWNSREGDGRWHDERYDLSAYLGVEDFKIRFVAKVSSSLEDVEVDNVRISGPKKKSAEPTSSGSSVSFTSDLNDRRDEITLLFSESISKRFGSSDFDLSHGTVRSVTNFADSDIRYLQVAGIPYDTQVAVEYVGSALSSSSGSSSLTPGSSATTNSVPDPDPPAPGRPSLQASDAFESGLGLWSVSGDGMWAAGSPAIPVPGGARDNSVLWSAACNSECVAELLIPLDTANPLLLELDRYVSRHATGTEGLAIEYSVDGGRSWGALASLTAEYHEDNGAWTAESILTDIAGPMKVRLVATSDDQNDRVEVDNFEAKSLAGSDQAVPGRVWMGFDGVARHMTLKSDIRHDVTWEVRAPHVPVPGAPSGNKVLASADCDIYCTATLDYAVDTSGPVLVEFDRFVDDNARRDEGLYVEYSVDGGSKWVQLASYTDRNDEDTNVWESESLTLDIQEDMAHIRLVANSKTPEDHIEVDNLSIRPKPDLQASLNPVQFTAVLAESGAEIMLKFTQPVARAVKATDFELSSGRATSVIPTSSYLATLAVSDVPYDTPITVTYTGDRVVPDRYNALYPYASAVTNPVSWPGPPPVISHISNVTVTVIKGISVPVSATDPEGMDVLFSLDGPTFVAIHDNRDGTAVITFSPGADDVGNHTIMINAFAGYRSASAQIMVEVTGDTSLQDVMPAEDPITGDIRRDTIVLEILRITPPPDIVIEGTGHLTPVDIGNSTVSSVDSYPLVYNNAPDAFALGNTTVTWTVVDSLGNMVEANQTITVQDTTPPVLTDLPSSKTITTYVERWLFRYIGEWLGVPTVTDAVDPHVPVMISTDAIAPYVAKPWPYENATNFYIGNTTVTYTATDDSGNTATHDVVVTLHRVPLDRFEPAYYDFEFIGGWQVHLFIPSKFDGYIDHTDGNPAPSLKLYDPNPNFGTARLWKAFDVAGMEGNFHLTMDVKISSESVTLPDGSVIRQNHDPHLIIYTSENTYPFLHSHTFKAPSAADAQWITHSATVPILDGIDAMAVAFYLYDSDNVNHFNQTLSIDNVYMNITSTPADVIRGGSVESFVIPDGILDMFPEDLTQGRDPPEVEVIDPVRREK